MTRGRRYLVGIATVAAAAVAFSFVVPLAARRGVWLALGIALAVQAPLGWWLVRAIGTDRFFPVWAAGLAGRLAVVAACGFVVAPRLGLPLEPTLFAVLGVLMASVVVEAIVVWLGQRGTQVR